MPDQSPPPAPTFVKHLQTGLKPGASLLAVALGAAVALGSAAATGLGGTLERAWTALLAAILPAPALQAPSQVWPSAAWSICLGTMVVWALWSVATSKSSLHRLTLLACGVAGSVMVAAVIGRGFSAADVAPHWLALALVGGILGKLAFEAWAHRAVSRQAEADSQLQTSLGQAKAQYLGQLTSELRVTVNAVLGVADLIAEDTTDIAKQRQLAVFRRAAESLSRTLGDVDELARVHGRQLQLQMAQLALLPLIHEQVNQVREEAENKGLQIHLTVAVDTPRCVMADARRLGQVIAHMLNHSVRSTRQGHIHLELRPHPRDKRMLRLAVTDTSMSPISAKLANLAAPFSEPVYDRARHGTGIGLTLAQQLAELMGGRLTVRHSAGRGTIMILTAILPSVVASDPGATPIEKPPVVQDPKAPQIRPQAPLRLNLADSGTKSVLLVDDNLSTRALIESMLDKEQFRVVTCSNGREALQALSIAPYDIVLMDLHMPVLDGTAAVQHLRALETKRGLKRTPVIALGDAPFDLERQRCLAAGFDLHLCKPVRKSRLLEGIASLVAALPAPSTSKRTGPAAGQRYAHRDALSLLAQGGVIDVNAAVEGLGGNAAIYLDAVEQLTPALYNWPARFRDTLARGETERARQMALDMQSILDVVRAVPCASALGRLAGVLAQPSPDRPLRDHALEELDQHMQALLQALRQAVDRLRQGRTEQPQKDYRHNSAL